MKRLNADRPPRSRQAFQLKELACLLAVLGLLLTSVEWSGHRYNRVRSIAMNGWMGESSLLDSESYRRYLQIDDSASPWERWVIGEELAGSINDGVLLVRMAPGPGVTIVDYPASYHAGGAWFTFMDGHVEFRRWEDARTIPTHEAGELVPHFQTMDPANPDIAWLQNHATEPQ